MQTAYIVSVNTAVGRICKKGNQKELPRISYIASGMSPHINGGFAIQAKSTAVIYKLTLYRAKRVSICTICESVQCAFFCKFASNHM